MRKPTVRAGELHVYYGRLDRYESPDVIYSSGGGVPRCDRSLLHHVIGSERMTLDLERGGHKFGPSLLDELEKRGYDLSTLRFSIKKKTQPEAKG